MRRVLCLVLLAACNAGAAEPLPEQPRERPDGGAPPARARPEPGVGVQADAILDLLVSELAPRNVTQSDALSEGRPQFSPDGRLLSFERREGSAQAIWLAQVQGPEQPLQRVSSAPPPSARSAEDALLGAAPRDASYNTQLSFLPDSAGFVFSGNGRAGAYRLYRGEVGHSPPRELTVRSREDGHPAVSPDGRWLAYISAREGAGRLMLRALEGGEERPLTDGSQIDLYPSWSPDSRSLAFTSGTNDNHNVFVVPDVTTPDARPTALTRWAFDDLRPTFSPDGEAIAFYSNFSPDGPTGEWSILMVPADGSGPHQGAALAEHVIARNVVTDIEVGPAWLPWGRALAYALNEEAAWNPIYVVDAHSGVQRRIETPTRMNHDLTCSSQGWLAFRAQVQSFDDIFVAALVEQTP